MKVSIAAPVLESNNTFSGAALILVDIAMVPLGTSTTPAAEIELLYSVTGFD